METGILKIFKQFSRIWKTKAIYKTDKIAESAKPCSAPTSTLKREDEILFQQYWVFLPTK